MQLISCIEGEEKYGGLLFLSVWRPFVFVSMANLHEKAPH